MSSAGDMAQVAGAGSASESAAPAAPSAHAEMVHGARTTVDGHRVSVGNTRLMQREHIAAGVFEPALGLVLRP